MGLDERSQSPAESTVHTALVAELSRDGEISEAETALLQALGIAAAAVIPVAVVEPRSARSCGLLWCS